MREAVIACRSRIAKYEPDRTFCVPDWPDKNGYFTLVAYAAARIRYRKSCYYTGQSLGAWGISLATTHTIRDLQ